MFNRLIFIKKRKIVNFKKKEKKLYKNTNIQKMYGLIISSFSVGIIAGIISNYINN
jgi:hypothetical protein